jgi:hypothetical protein
MRGIPSLAKPIMDQRGPLGMIAKRAILGAGAGVVSNVIDKELLKSKLKEMKVALPVQFTDFLKGPTGTVVVTANLTDAGMLLLANGLRVPNTKSIILMASLWLGKKLAEARGWIVDDEIGAPQPQMQAPCTTCTPQPQYSGMGVYGGLN